MNKVATLVSGNNKVEIKKIVKDGTGRIFFYPTFNNVRINSTNYARKYDAENLGKAFLKHIAIK